MEYEIIFESMIVEADNKEEAEEEAKQQVIIGNLQIESIEQI
jgi:hypothetical protein